MPPSPPQPPTTSPRDPQAWLYDAMLSYHAASDGPVSARLRSLLVRLAPPRDRRRGVDVYRDRESGLRRPDTRRGLREAVRGARFLILLARPESAASDWVRWELEQWIDEQRSRGLDPADALIVVRTAGVVARTSPGQQIDWPRTTALPDALDNPWSTARLRLSSFLDMPRVIDLEPLGEVEARRQELEAAAEISALLRGVKKEDILSEEVLRERRARRRTLAVSGVLALLAALIAAFALSLDTARLQAIDRERVSESRRLALASESTTHLDTRLLLAAEAYDVAPTPESRAALRSALDRSRNLDGLAHDLPRGMYRGASYAPDLDLVATVDLQSRTALLLDGDGRDILRVPGASAIHVASDGSAVAWAKDDRLFVAALEGPRLTAPPREVELPQALQRPDELRIAPAERRISVCSRAGSLGVWDLQSWNWLGAIHPGSPGRGSGASAAPASMRGASSRYSNVSWIDLSGNSVLARRELRDGDRMVHLHGLVTDPGGRLLLAYVDNSIWILDPARDLATVWQAPLEGDPGAWTQRFGATLDPSGSIALVRNQDGTVQAWSIPGGEVALAPAAAHRERVGAAAFGDAHRFVTIADDGSVARWDLGRNAQETCEPHASVVLPALPAAGRWSFKEQRALGVWLTLAAPVVRGGADDPNRAAAFAFATRDAAGNDLELLTHRSMAELSKIPDEMAAAPFGEAGPRLAPGQRSLDALALSPDGSLLALGSDAGDVVLVSADGEWRGALRPLEASVMRLAFAPHSRNLIVGGRDGNLVAIDVDDYRVRWRVPAAHDDFVWDVAVSDSQKVVISSGPPRSVRAWSLESGQSLGPGWRASGDYPTLCCSEDGDRVGCGDNEHQTSWTLDPRDWQARARQLAGRALTASERTTFAVREVEAPSLWQVFWSALLD